MENDMDIQNLIDTGTAWRLEGAVGRACMEAIENGDAILGPVPRTDYWGNVVPAWWMVEDGTKGSPSYADVDAPFDADAAAEAFHAEDFDRLHEIAGVSR